MANERPPTIDPIAARHWQQVAPARSPWLHDEVGRRMEERLQWIRMAPATWVDWEPLRGGMATHALLERRYPRSECIVHETHPQRAQAVLTQLTRPWWRRWTGRPLQHGSIADGSAQMLWSNMALHMAADPQTLLGTWHKALAVDGFLMFSCLGPDTLRELRALYRALGWPPPGHDFTDMHDWGDMLVHAGFAEPVMDMEHITLTWETPQRLLAELRELGANLHPGRFAGLRGRQWRSGLEQELARTLTGPDGRLALTFEIIYGHALKPRPRVRIGEKSSISLKDMRAMLHPDKRPGG
jgi:malonyl-CoA O-methyltransferase